MNAQEEGNESEIYWRECYHRLKHTKRYSTRRKVRREMKRYRREAALERRIEYLEADLKLAQQQVAESEERREFAARMEFGG